LIFARIAGIVMLEKLIASVLLLITLLSIVATLTVSCRSENEIGAVEISMRILPVIDIIIPTDICSWELKSSETGTFTKKGIIRVRANTAWRIIAKNADQTTAAYMAEWTGLNYSTKKLKTPLRISAKHGTNFDNSGVIQEGANSEGQDVEVILTQVISLDDLKLKDGHDYRIDLTYVVSPM
jgi:hypothetical protein